MDNTFKNALLEVQLAYQNLRDTGEDWVEDCLREIDDDVLNNTQMDDSSTLAEAFEDSGMSIEEIFMSDKLTDEHRLEMLRQWPDCYYEMTEEELEITSISL